MDAIKQLGNDSKTEIFPDIYIAKVERISLLKRIRSFIAQEKTYIIRNENKRDYYEICSELEKTNRPPHSEGRILSNQVEYVNPQEVVQPINLGGGECGGCPLHSYFSLLDLQGEGHDGYYFFDNREIYEATRHEPFFLDCCRQSRCFETYNKIIDEGYSENLDDYDQIKVTYEHGTYFAGEGKHRICAMKRFGYSKEIPMIVTRVEETEGIPDSKDLFDTDYYSDMNYYSDMKHILESCYSHYERIGISSENVKRLLKDPQATILDYLKASKYSYKEIYDVHLAEIDAHSLNHSTING